jgi:DNA-binding transcriptional LysR family regulator
MLMADDLIVFSTVVRLGSFVGAARELRMPKSTVSRRLSDLEAALNVRLLERSTRSLTLTEIGRLLIDHADRVASEAAEVENLASQERAAPRGLLKIAAPYTFAALFIEPMLGEFSSKFPDVKVHLQLTNAPINPGREGYDLALRIGLGDDSGAIARPLGKASQGLFAAASYLSTQTLPAMPSDLARHATIVTSNLADSHGWRFGRDGVTERIALEPVIVVNDPKIALQLALSGRGIALLPSFMGRPYAKDNALTPLLVDWSLPDIPFYAIYPDRRGLLPKTSAFLDSLSLWMKHLDIEELWQTVS